MTAVGLGVAQVVVSRVAEEVHSVVVHVGGRRHAGLHRPLVHVSPVPSRGTRVVHVHQERRVTLRLAQSVKRPL